MEDVILDAHFTLKIGKIMDKKVTLIGIIVLSNRFNLFNDELLFILAFLFNE